jgi:hypothetical protein
MVSHRSLKLHVSAVAALLLFGAGTALAQQAPSPAREVGTVKAITAQSVTLTTDAGAQVSVALSPTIHIYRVHPGQKNLTGAVPVTLADVQPGDRLLVSGKPASDGTFTASVGLLMKQSEIEAQRQQEQMDWQRRGIGGLVRTVDTAAGTVTISTASFAGPKMTTVRVTKETQIRRYAPDSVKFDDARPSTLDAIHPGDQLRAKGERSADGNELMADEIVVGTFRYVSGIVGSVDAATQTITINDLATHRPVAVAIGADSQLRQLPPMAAQMLAARLRRQAGGAPGGMPGSAQGRAAAPTAGNSGWQRGSGGAGAQTGTAGRGQWNGAGAGYGQGSSGTPGQGRRGDLQQMLNRLPSITIADLHPGEAVMLVSTEGTPTVAPKVVELLSGVEPLLAAAPRGGQAGSILSPWTLGGGAQTGGDSGGGDVPQSR